MFKFHDPVDLKEAEDIIFDGAKSKRIVFEVVDKPTVKQPKVKEKIAFAVIDKKKPVMPKVKQSVAESPEFAFNIETIEKAINGWVLNTEKEFIRQKTRLRVQIDDIVRTKKSNVGSRK